MLSAGCWDGSEEIGAGEASETEGGAAGCPQEMSVKASRIPRGKVKIAFMCMGIDPFFFEITLS